MKIKLLFLTAFLGLGQLVSAQSQQLSQNWYEPAPNTVKIAFPNPFTTNQQTSVDGNRMVIAYEKASEFSFNLISIYPKAGEKMDVMAEDRFMRQITDQAQYYTSKTGNKLAPTVQTLPNQTGFAATFAIDSYTYSYRVVVLDNVYYLFSASYPTVRQGDPAIAAFFNSFAVQKPATTRQ